MVSSVPLTLSAHARTAKSTQERALCFMVCCHYVAAAVNIAPPCPGCMWGEKKTSVVAAARAAPRGPRSTILRRAITIENAFSSSLAVGGARRGAMPVVIGISHRSRPY